MSSDQVSGRKYSATFSMMVCRMESRLSDEVSALATSWKIDSSCRCRLRSVAAASLIVGPGTGKFAARIIRFLGFHSIARTVRGTPKVPDREGDHFCAGVFL